MEPHKLVEMDEHQHAVLHRALVSRLDAALRELSGGTIKVFQRAFERNGLLTMALQLPEVRRALTTILVNSLTVNTDTGEESLDIDEDAIVEALTPPTPALSVDDLEHATVNLDPRVRALSLQLLRVIMFGEPSRGLADEDRVDALTNTLTTFLAALIVQHGGEWTLDRTFQELNEQTREKIERFRGSGI